MRIGKTQEQILKVMYDFENSEGYQFGRQYGVKKGKPRKELMRIKEVVEKITGLQNPKEKDFGINNEWRFNEIIKATAKIKHNIKEEDKETKNWQSKVKAMQEKEKEWHDATTSVYRSIKLLRENKLLLKGRFGLRKHSCSDYIHLTESGRRVASHRK